MHKTIYRSLLCCFVLLTTTFLFSEQSAQYSVSFSLSEITKDRLKITVIPPKNHGKDQLTYIMPKVVPGTYSNLEFAQFLKDPIAYDADGNKLPIIIEADKQVTISNAAKLAKFEYWIDDSFDGKPTTQIFEPGGTSFEKDTVFLLNLFGVIGYFENVKENIPYELSIEHPSFLYGSTALDRKSSTETVDVFTAKNYDHLADNPIMYSKPDTFSYKQGNTTVSIAVYSQKKGEFAQSAASEIKPVTAAIEKFLGTMPVDKYFFLIYYVDISKGTGSMMRGFGALEHSYSSVYYIPLSAGKDNSMLPHVAAHEFLHILVPLNLHSNEIANFDFRNPKMSEHLWLYEGVTEYFANLALVKNKRLTEEEFLKEMRGKLIDYENGKPFSITEMSKNVLEPGFKSLYMKVYTKGAILAFLLDIEIQRKTNGTMNLLKVIEKLTQKYGPNRPFNDPELIPEFVALTHPDIQEFFSKYVVGSEKPKYPQFLTSIRLELRRIWNQNKNIISRYFI
jgi:predicted metalloprotease with PDZ domain